MPRTRQLSDLRNDVRVRCDLVGSAFPIDADITELVNQAIAELTDLLIASDQKYGLLNATFTTTNGTDTYDLTAYAPTFYVLQGVDVQISGTQWVDAHRFQFERRNDYATVSGSWSWPSDVYYDLWGTSLKFIPMPSGAYSVRFYYYPSATRLVNNTDTFDGIDGWERYVVDWAAKVIAERDDNWELSASLGASLAKLEQRIKTMSSIRNAGEAPKMRIARGRMWSPGLPRRWWTW